jgi:hypothetical protein
MFKTFWPGLVKARQRAILSSLFLCVLSLSLSLVRLPDSQSLRRAVMRLEDQ